MRWQYIRRPFGHQILLGTRLHLWDTVSSWWDVDWALIFGCFASSRHVGFLNSKIGAEEILVGLLLSWECLWRTHFDLNIYVLFSPITICLLADAVLSEINLVNRFGSWVVDLSFLRSFGDIHSFLVNEMNQLLPLFIGNWFVLFAHGE